MNKRNIIFIPGKNPKPPADQHRELLWRTLLEGIRRAEPELFDELHLQADNFKLIAWNYLYYKQNKDISRDLPWIDALCDSVIKVSTLNTKMYNLNLVANETVSQDNFLKINTLRVPIILYGANKN